MPREERELQVAKSASNVGWRPNRALERKRDESKLWLDRNENRDPIFHRFIQQTLSSLPVGPITTYPESQDLYQKLATLLNVSSDQLLITNGVEGGIRSTFHAYVDPGDKVLLSHPTYAMYRVYADMFQAESVVCRFNRNDQSLSLDAEEIKQKIAKHSPALIFIPNPDSPCGGVIPRSALEEIIYLARDVGAIVFIDETYYPFYPHTVVDLIDDCPNLLVARSASKAWGLAGLRIGFVVGHSELILNLNKVSAAYETNMLGLMMFSALVDHQDQVNASVKRLNHGKAYFEQAMNALGFETLSCSGNFSLVNFSSELDKIQGVLKGLVYAKWEYDCSELEGFSRFTATTEEEFLPVIETIRDLI